MTSVSTIIGDALRESNLIGINATPTDGELTEGLRRLNAIINSLFGYEVGENLKDYPLGTIGQASNWVDYPGPYDRSYVTPNSRMIPNISQAMTVYLPRNPSDGCRIGIVDPLNTLSTYNVTLDGNGRSIVGAPTLVLSTDGLTRTWMYRADLGEWVVLSALTDVTTDELPFPDEFDDYFVTQLAIRTNSKYGRGLADSTLATQQRLQKQLRARYSQHEQMPSELGLIISDYYGYSDFSKGIG